MVCKSLVRYRIYFEESEYCVILCVIGFFIWLIVLSYVMGSDVM